MPSYFCSFLWSADIFFLQNSEDGRFCVLIGCKDYQQTTLAGRELTMDVNKFPPFHLFFNMNLFHYFYTLFLLGNMLHAFCRLLIFFRNQLFQKIYFRNIPSECQTVWFQIRPDVLSGLIWFQTVCKGYQQTTLVGKELNLNWLVPV